MAGLAKSKDRADALRYKRERDKACSGLNYAIGFLRGMASSGEALKHFDKYHADTLRGKADYLESHLPPRARARDT